MDDPVLALLALMEHNGSRAGLARALASRPAVELVSDPAWSPSPRSWRRAARSRRALEVLGIRCLPRADLPARIAGAKPPPPALFCRGDAALLGASAIGIVGARRASRGPLAWAADAARRAVSRGLLVVSGGALGVDAAAHRGALAAGGRTLVYHGVQADQIYPRRHRRLFELVLERRGALVSEHPPMAEVFPACHAARNRFIAAHAAVLLVAEARAGSGSLGTAAFAWRLGVPVVVPPASVGGERAGIDELLAAGRARVVEDGAAIDAVLDAAAGTDRADLGRAAGSGASGGLWPGGGAGCGAPG